MSNFRFAFCVYKISLLHSQNFNFLKCLDSRISGEYRMKVAQTKGTKVKRAKFKSVSHQHTCLSQGVHGNESELREIQTQAFALAHYQPSSRHRFPKFYIGTLVPEQRGSPGGRWTWRREMGNSQTKIQVKGRNKKQVHWKAAGNRVRVITLYMARCSDASGYFQWSVSALFLIVECLPLEGMHVLP